MSTREKAKALRKASTAAEDLLWQQLRNRRLAGYKFRRQFPIEHYIVDFVCPSEKLVIELDGEYHTDPEQQANDQLRTLFLQVAGYHVLRFWNDDIIQDMPNTLATISNALAPPRPVP